MEEAVVGDMSGLAAKGHARQHRTMTESATHVDPRDRAAIDAFLESVWSRDGLADLTLTDYRGDLERCAAWLGKHAHGLLQASREDLFRYLAARNLEGVGARTNARELTALRRFYAEQVRRDAAFEDPTLLLDTPKLPRTLPKALAEREIEGLLEAPDTATPIGLRDRAMLELMYACGLRVRGSSHTSDMSALALSPSTAWRPVARSTRTSAALSRPIELSSRAVLPPSSTMIGRVVRLSSRPYFSRASHPLPVLR